MNIEFKGKLYIINSIEDLNRVQNMLTTAFMSEKCKEQDLNDALDKIFDGINNGDEALADLVVDRITENERMVDNVVVYALRNTDYSSIDDMTDAMEEMCDDYAYLSNNVRDILYKIEKWC